MKSKQVLDVQQMQHLQKNWAEHAGGRALHSLVWHRLEFGTLPAGKRQTVQAGAAVPGYCVQADLRRYCG